MHSAPSASQSFKDAIHPRTLPFWAIHVVAVWGVIATGFSWTGVAWAVGLYYARMFFITAGFHRYFAHRSYKTSRWFQFVLAFGGETAAQKGVLWWAGHHRVHHRFSDQPGDVHSPREGLFWSHVGWIISTRWEETDFDGIKDMARYPELRFLNKFHLLPPTMLAVALYFIGGPVALFWGFFLSTVLCWHGTFTINSLSHIFGRRRYETTDDSKNNWVLALITMGEGWHNNHHHYMSSCNQGFRWYELDMSYLILRALGAVGIVWDIRKAPDHIVHNLPKPVRARQPAPELMQEAA